MPQKGFAPILILIGILVMGVLIGGGYFLGAKQNIKVPVSSVAPAPAVSAQPSPSAIATPNEQQWQKYESGQVLAGIAINYPKGWVVNYKKEYNLGTDYIAKYRLDFDFAPADWKSSGSIDWMGWGSISFDVYDRQKDINEWINKNLSKYKDGLVSKEDTKIGGKPTFLVSSRDVILGTDYSYEVGLSQNGYISPDGKDNFRNILKEKIYPAIQIN